MPTTADKSQNGPPKTGKRLIFTSRLIKSRLQGMAGWPIVGGESFVSPTKNGSTFHHTTNQTTTKSSFAY